MLCAMMQSSLLIASLAASVEEEMGGKAVEGPDDVNDDTHTWTGSDRGGQRCMHGAAR